MKLLLELFRLPVSLLSTLSGVAAYLLAAGTADPRLAGVGLGIFLLAGAASALNQVQERRFDALMQRTRRRPLPAGRISPAAALVFAATLLAAGLILLGVSTSGGLSVSLGLLAVGWYNLVYTPLKRVSAFAALPGALVGALPPAIGWSAGGGELLSPVNIVLMGLLFVWQVPHFWFLLLIHGDDYERAGYPTPLKYLGYLHFVRITLLWFYATLSLTVMLPLFGLLNHVLLYGTVVLFALWSGSRVCGCIMTLTPDVSLLRRSFTATNQLAAIVLVMLIIDKSVG
ncbi:MAG: protoheme IX farnesyltransferase [Acidobacteria bacterium]|nr:protoheme IX farnesyltransferase [Acidobacteriota bacterium]